MGQALWIILVMALIIGICLVMFVRGHIKVKNLAGETDGKKSNDTNATSWLPSPADKYLPAWVILSMAIAVWVLASQMNLVVKEVCATEGRCQTAVDSDETKAKAAKAAKAKAEAKSEIEAEAKAKLDEETKKQKVEAASASAATDPSPTVKGK